MLYKYLYMGIYIYMYHSFIFYTPMDIYTCIYFIRFLFGLGQYFSGRGGGKEPVILNEVYLANTQEGNVKHCWEIANLSHSSTNLIKSILQAERKWLTFIQCSL